MPYARDAVTERASAQLNTVADLKTIQVHTWLNGGKNVVQLAGELREVAEMLPLLLSRPDEADLATAKLKLRLEIKALSDVFPLVRSVSVLHPETGLVMISTDPTLEGRDRSEEYYYREGRKGPFVSPVHYSLGREEPVLIVSAPVFRPDGEPQAVFAAELNLSDLAATISSRSGLGRSGEAYLVDHRGYFVTLPEKIEDGPPLLSVLARSTGVQRAIAGQSGLDTYDDSRGVPVIGVYRWLANEQMVLLVEVDASEVFGQIYTAWTLIAFAALVLLAISTVAAHKLAGWLGRPLAEITDAAHALRGGDLSRRVPADVRDEIGQFATAFNDMAEEIELSYEGLEHIIAQRTAGLEEAEARLRSVVETASDAIVSVDDSLMIIMFNQAAERMLGCPAGAAMGQPMSNFIAEQDYNSLADPAASLPKGVEISARRTDGQSFPAEVSVSSTLVDGQTIRTIILRDITERKQAEEQLARLNEDLERRVEERTAALQEAQEALLQKERLATLGQLTATVSHEIRNPLGVMITTLYTLEKQLTDAPPAVLKGLDRLRRNVRRCDIIIDDLLDYSRVRVSEPKPTKVDRWLGELLDEQSLSDDVTLDFAPGLNDVEAPIDRERLRRAVINIIENAVQAIKETGKTGRISVSTVADGPRFRIRIADDGPGISEEQRGRIFEPLFSTKNFGVGLGLVITRQIVEQHDGEISVESDPPEGGACFVLRLPTQSREALKP